MGTDLLEIAREWSYWDRPVPGGVERRVELPAHLTTTRALVIQGVRRCGKSTLMVQLMARYGLDPADCVFLNFEDPRLAAWADHTLLDDLVDEFAASRPGSQRLTYFLDELQGVSGWQKWLRSRLDRRGRYAFVVSGSNATMLSGELSSALTGRHLTVELYPFDLVEARAHRAPCSVERFFHEGGFPEPLGDPDGDMLRRQYFDDIIERDIRERIGARSVQPIRQVLQMVYESTGAQLSLRRIAGAAGIAVETARGYLDAAQAAYMLFEVPYFAFSARKRAARNAKYYPIDPGLRRCVVTPTGADRGKALECATYLALRRRYGAVSYWYDRGEVDFVVQEGDTIQPIQVTWNEPEERHLRALESFYEAFPRAAEARFVTAENFEQLAG